LLPPLRESESLVTLNSAAFDRPRDEDRCILDLDVRSTTTKAVLMRAGGHSTLASLFTESGLLNVRQSE
jgi:activator of 2-hydroxyglutaryl-CoA dehydratase